jgi:hypothetical protein
VTFTDVESNSSLIIKGFSAGTPGGLGTNNARTVLKAADFATVGNMDGKLDQNECLVLYDTLMAVGSTSPIAGTYTANWGCNSTACSNPSSNTFVLNTTINASSPQQPALTRTLVALGPPDTPGQIYNRPVKYMEIVKNNSSVTAVNAKVMLMVYGLKYINTDSVWVSKNGGVPYHPSMLHYTGGANWMSWSSGTPADYAGSLIPFANSGQPSNEELSLGDLVPGDSVVITFEVRTAGPVTRVNVTPFDHCYTTGESFCGGCARGMWGPAISGAVDARMTWQGCPSGTFTACAQRFPQTVYNGLSPTPLTEYDPTNNYGHFLANFSGFSFIDSTNLNGMRCAYYDNDTVRVLMTAGSMDLPFYTDKSKFCIKIYTNGGSHWDGNLARTFGRLSSWSNNPWYADHVVDSSAIDSTIRVYFRRSNCPVPNFTTNNAYNSYRAIQWQLAIGFINTCPGPAQKRLYMTRIFTIDTTNGEPGIESGPTTFPASYTWNSNCASSCTDGVSILNYKHARTTLDEPDNNNDGIPDPGGSLNMNVVNTNLITWSDTLQTHYKMVVHTTQPGGVPYMYIKSSINHATASMATTCNNFLLKTYPQVTLKRGSNTYTGVGTSTPVSSTNQYVVDLSLQGSGGVPISGINAYQEGDTLEVTENLVYWTPHEGWGPTTFSFVHVPYTSLAANPAPAQQYKCDSAVCNFQTLDMNTVQDNFNANPGISCGDSMMLQYTFYSQTTSASCGANYFPGETRSIMTATYFKMAVPASSSWSVHNVYLSYQKKIHGTGACSNQINAQLLPTSLYTQVGDTLYFNLRQIGQFYGQQIDTNDTRSAFTMSFNFKYQPTVTDTGCTKDHAFPQTFFYTFTRFTTRRPMDSTNLRNIINTTTRGTYGGNGGSVFLNWPGGNNNYPTLYAGSTQQVTSPQVTVPFTYHKGAVSGNDFFALPAVAGIVVDSVKDDVTGNIITPIGGDIYPVGYLPNGNRNFKIYARVVLCNNSALKIYTDRLPCSGYPASWTSYSCKSYATSATYNFITFSGELQMSDSLFSTQKDICTKDTVQFKVVNSQTQTADSVKISFTLPANMSLVSGQTFMKYGNGAFTSTSDPVFNAGTYTWTQPVGDTLAPINAAPNNLLYLRAVVNTSCGYVSGSQIYSSIAGNVACGPVTALFNTNPLPLHINGAPSLSYLTNVSASAAPITGCSATPGYDYRVSMHISGSATGSSDSVMVALPPGYGFVSYNPLAPGSTHAPAGVPIAAPLANGSTQLSWVIPGGIAGGDSIIFTFKYNETSAATNKCGTAPQSFVSTQITSGVFCASIGATCAVAISNGGDTVDLQSLKPNITNITTVGELGDANGTVIPGQQSYLHMEGTWTNDGTANAPAGTNIVMEPFVDLDNSGTITPGDYALDPLTYNGGLAMNGSYAYNYTDSFSPAACPTCGGKDVLVRFSNNPSSPAGASQCFCDSVIVTPVLVTTTPLNLKLGVFKGVIRGCNQAVLNWNTYEESGMNEHFEVQQSTDGSAFNTVGTIVAKGEASQYEYIVSMPAPRAYFRLLMHSGGEKDYSKVIALTSECWGGTSLITVSPNPFISTINVNGAKESSIISLKDIAGRQLLRQVASGSGIDILNIQSLAGGAYVLIITDSQGQVTRIKISKE